MFCPGVMKGSSRHKGFVWSLISVLELQLCLDYLWRVLQNIPKCRDRNKYHLHPEINLDYHPSKRLSMTSTQATCKFLRGDCRLSAA